MFKPVHAPLVASPAMSLGHTILVLVIYVLAVASVVRLINYDTILDFVRIAISSRAEAAYTAAGEAETMQQPVIAAEHMKRMGRWNTCLHFMACPWCVSFWVALPTSYVPVSLIGWPAWALIPVTLATRYVVGTAAPLSADKDMTLQGG